MQDLLLEHECLQIPNQFMFIYHSFEKEKEKTQYIYQFM